MGGSSTEDALRAFARACGLSPFPRLPPTFWPCHDARDPRIRKPMRVFSVPVSVPFLRSVIAALIDGRLVDGFEARADPSRLAGATLYLPTRRAGRMARELFLDELNSDA